MITDKNSAYAVQTVTKAFDCAALFRRLEPHNRY